ncbi:MAG: hypothetical protein LAO23_21285 [Acidobacteriia bacterium]|jgi:hypothetical protein|nr:hypothetical protein [Terriglobia bacterium]
MLVADHLRPAAAKAGVFKNEVRRRFGFHNPRHSLSSFLITEKKADVRTVQDTLRYAKPDMTLGGYTKCSMKSRIAAQEQVLDAILARPPGRTRFSRLQWMLQWIGILDIPQASHCRSLMTKEIGA